MKAAIRGWAQPYNLVDPWILDRVIQTILLWKINPTNKGHWAHAPYAIFHKDLRFQIDSNFHSESDAEVRLRGDVDQPKTEASKRTKKLSPPVSEFARRYPGQHKREQYIFLGDDGLTPPDERDILRYEVRPALKRLKLWFAGFGWHQFRRTQITIKQTVGGSTPLEAQKGAGHSRVDTTLLYTLVDAHRDQEQVTRMFNWLMGPVEGPKQ